MNDRTRNVQPDANARAQEPVPVGSEILLTSSVGSFTSCQNPPLQSQLHHNEKSTAESQHVKVLHSPVSYATPRVVSEVMPQSPNAALSMPRAQSLASSLPPPPPLETEAAVATATVRHRCSSSEASLAASAHHAGHVAHPPPPAQAHKLSSMESLLTRDLRKDVVEGVECAWEEDSGTHCGRSSRSAPAVKGGSLAAPSRAVLGSDGSGVPQSILEVRSSRLFMTGTQSRQKQSVKRRRAAAAARRDVVGKLHVYSVPPLSYYVQHGEDVCCDSSRRSSSATAGGNDDSGGGDGAEQQATFLTFGAHSSPSPPGANDNSMTLLTLWDHEHVGRASTKTMSPPHVTGPLADVERSRTFTPTFDPRATGQEGRKNATTAERRGSHIAHSDVYTDEDFTPSPVMKQEDKPGAKLGRLLNRQRFCLPPCPPYRIPLFDQVCVKYLFSNMFDPRLQIMELFFLLQMLVLVVVNVLMTIVNVFFNQSTSELLPWMKVASVVVFSVEMGVVLALVFFVVVLLVHGLINNCIGTKLAQDVAAVVTFAGTFSMLRVVGLASPSFAFRRILPIFQNAIGIVDVLKGVLYVAMWIFACLIATLSLTVKVTQIDFAFSTSITEWRVIQYIQLFGLLLNLARVDDSYYKETSVLLDAVHRHFSTPGEPREASMVDAKPSLYTRMLRAMGLQWYMYYEYFDTVFNYHIDPYTFAGHKHHKKAACTRDVSGGNSAAADAEVVNPPRAIKMRRMLNYLAFIFEIDTVQLRRYLQMTQSPLPFYRVGRESFMAAFMERDLVGMDVAVWRSDPIASATRKYAEVAPGQFDIAFECEDRRDIWDPDYNAFMEQAEKARAGEMANVLAKRHSRRPASSLRHSHSNAGAQSLHAQERRSAKPKAR